MNTSSDLRLSAIRAALDTAREELSKSGVDRVPFGWTDSEDEQEFLVATSALVTELGLQFSRRGLASTKEFAQISKWIDEYSDRFADNPACVCRHSPYLHSADGCSVDEREGVESSCRCANISGLAEHQLPRDWVPTVGEDFS